MYNGHHLKEWVAVLWNWYHCYYSSIRISKAKRYVVSSRLVSPDVQTYLLVSNFSLPSWTLSVLWAAWESWDTVELSVLTPEVAIASSMTMQGCWIVWFWGWSSWSSSTSISSWSAASLSDARLKCGLNSVRNIKIKEKTGKINIKARARLSDYLGIILKFSIIIMILILLFTQCKVTQSKEYCIWSELAVWMLSVV